MGQTSAEQSFLVKWLLKDELLCRYTPVTGCVEGAVIANGQQGVEAINYTGE